MTARILLSIALISSSLQIGLAQDIYIDSLEQKRLRPRAYELYDEYSFDATIKLIERKLKKEDTGNANQVRLSDDLLMILGNSHFYKAQYKEVAKYLGHLISADTLKKEPNLDAEYYFRYVVALNSITNDTNIISKFQKKYLERSSTQSSKDPISDEKCNLQWTNLDTDGFTLETIEKYINSDGSDFAPSFFKDSLIFASDRSRIDRPMYDDSPSYRDSWTSGGFFNLYMVRRKPDSISIKPDSNNRMKLLPRNINSGFHKSTSVVSNDGKYLYFTSSNFVVKSKKKQSQDEDGKKVYFINNDFSVNDVNYKRDMDGVIRLKIYRAESVNGAWDSIKELRINRDSYSVAHPALSPDGKTLYFASDKPGTRGGSDLFSVPINEDGTVGKIQPLKCANTEGRETFPFVSEDGVLYFSSDGHPGLGGLDIFAAKVNDGKLVSKVVNIGAPINSECDDFTFIIKGENERVGYFASNRPRPSELIPTECSDDNIYKFKYEKATE